MDLERNHALSIFHFFSFNNLLIVNIIYKDNYYKYYYTLDHEKIDCLLNTINCMKVRYS